MPWWRLPGFTYPLKQMLTAKSLYFITCATLVCILWIQLTSKEDAPADENLAQEALLNVGQDLRYADVYRKTSRLPKDLKYILLWTPQDFAPLNYLGTGQRAFIENKCSVINCYVTNDRGFFDGDLNKFDAIAFNGRNILNMRQSQLPKARSVHQKYIYFNMESSDNFPVCNPIFDNFFNWTATYKLNSDIPYPYILIRNIEGKVVGPRQNMKWLEDMPEVDDDLAERLHNKSKAAAWFVSHCGTRSGRKEFVDKLEKELTARGLHVDVYGKCGTLKCPRSEYQDCNLKLEKEYFFYLAMENSFAEDYVTEKLLTALQHFIVPIVYGGANYSRFLPPGSYLDARKQEPRHLADLIYKLMRNPKVYLDHFRWTRHYTYHDPSKAENVCGVCEALNNKTKVETSTTYADFRSWWNPEYPGQCKKWLSKLL